MYQSLRVRMGITSPRRVYSTLVTVDDHSEVHPSRI